MPYNADIMIENQYHNNGVYVSSDLDLKPYPIYVGDVLHVPDELIKMHTHGHYEFSLFIFGETEVIVGQKKYIVKPGDLLVTKPGDIHEFGPSIKDSMGFYYFGIAEIVPEDLAFVYMKNRHRLFTDCWDMEPLFAQLYNEAKYPKFGVQHVMHGIMTRILYLLARKMSPGTKDRQASCEIVGVARAYIDANLHHGITIKQVADYCCLSESRLSHVFTEKTGMSISGYINHVLMHSAIRMLEDTGNSITGIASELDYPSPQYFSRVFKKFWGYSPRECRLSMRKIHSDHNVHSK